MYNVYNIYSSPFGKISSFQSNIIKYCFLFSHKNNCIFSPVVSRLTFWKELYKNGLCLITRYNYNNNLILIRVIVFKYLDCYNLLCVLVYLIYESTSTDGRNKNIYLVRLIIMKQQIIYDQVVGIWTAVCRWSFTS